MDVDGPKVDLEGQGHRSKVKTQVKKAHFRSHLAVLRVIYEVKGHMDKGQRSTLKVKVKPQGRLNQKCDFRSH